MIIGIGTDMCDISRIERVMAERGQQFVQRLLAPNEVAEPNFPSTYAKRFAAKEAVAKALGTGIGEKLGFKDIRIDHTPSGQPIVVLSAEAQKLVGQAGKVHLSLSDEGGFALAFAVAERKD